MKTAKVSEFANPAEGPDRFHIRLVVAVSSMLVGAIVFKDWIRNEAVSVASLFTAPYPLVYRNLIHGSTLPILALFVFARPNKLTFVITASLALVILNALATTRTVTLEVAAPYSAVAGFELTRISVRQDPYEPAFVCYQKYSRTDRAAPIDGTTLSPTLLPFPVQSPPSGRAPVPSRKNFAFSGKHLATARCAFCATPGVIRP